jgi:Amt family ammonium transporter
MKMLDAETAGEFARNIHNSGTHLLNLINDILDLSKIESGKMKLQLVQFPLSVALEEIALTIRPLIQKKNITLCFEHDRQIEIITADQGKLRQIVLNLVSNAIKFSPENTSITIRTVLRDKHVEISVADRGIGIKAEDIPKLFQTFYQLDGSHSRKHEGTGLGLALTKKLVELHGGKVWVESEFGQGSTFVFSLPMIR